MKNILSILFLVAAINASAQKVPFEKLDSLSQRISSLQYTANGLKYQDRESKLHQFSFSKESFKVMVSDRSAYQSYYETYNGKEVINLIEQIDFSKAIGIAYSSRVSDKQLFRVNVYFPDNYVKVQQYEAGKPVQTISRDYVDFYVKIGYDNKLKQQSYETLENALFELCTALQIENGLTTADKIKQENEDLKTLDRKDFIMKYPKSLRVKEMERRITVEKDKGVADVLEALCKQYKYWPGITTEKFFELNPEAQKFYQSQYTTDSKTYTNPYGGSGVYNFTVKDNIVTKYSYVVSGMGDYRTQYDAVVKDIKAKVPGEYLIASGSGNKPFISIIRADVKFSVDHEVYQNLSNYVDCITFEMK